jgi:hypothetical protein
VLDAVGHEHQLPHAAAAAVWIRQRGIEVDEPRTRAGEQAACDQLVGIGDESIAQLDDLVTELPAHRGDRGAEHRVFLEQRAPACRIAEP